MSLSLDVIVRLGGRKMRLRVSGDRRLAFRLGRIFGVRPRSARGAADLDLRWEGKRGAVRSGRRLIRRSDDRDELCVWMEWAASSEALRRLDDRIILHAASLVRGRRGLLIAGPHGSGKTSLALTLRDRHRWRLCSEDVVLLAAGGRVTPFRRPIRVKGPRGVELRPLPPHPDGAARGPDAIVLLALPHGGPLRYSRVGEGLAVARLARLTWRFKERPGASLTALGSLVRGVPVWEVRGGTVGERGRTFNRLAGTIPVESAPIARILRKIRV